MPPTDLRDHPELAGLVKAAEQPGRVQLIGELARMMRERVRWPSADLFIEMLSGLVDREPIPPWWTPPAAREKWPSLIFPGPCGTPGA
jgi:hypothetical protein